MTQLQLTDQGRFFGELTEQALRMAGLRAGERVLDVGCGTGDLSFRAARLVGTAGRVIGVDAAEEAVDTAGGRAAELGLRLRRLLREAGLPEPQLVQHARAEGGPDSEVYRVVADLARGVLPLMEQHGVASADGLDIDTLADRLRAEALAHDAVLVPPPLVAGWTRVPA